MVPPLPPVGVLLGVLLLVQAPTKAKVVAR